jgi:hypothetical protein
VSEEATGPEDSRGRGNSPLRWWMLALAAIAVSSSYYEDDVIGPIADLLHRQRGFSQSRLGMLNGVISIPNVALALINGVLIDRYGPARIALWAAAAHDSWRYPSSARSKVQDTVTSHATPSQDLKAGNRMTSIQAPVREEKAKNDNSIKPVSAFSGIDESVVGQPFPISASIREGCKSGEWEFRREGFARVDGCLYHAGGRSGVVWGLRPDSLRAGRCDGGFAVCARMSRRSRIAA